MFAPYALSKILANPKLSRVITDGFIAGPGTSKFARAVLVAGIQNREALGRMGKISPEAQEFYDQPYEEGTEQPQINFPVTDRMLQPPPLT
jgi:hypothetical protein